MTSTAATPAQPGAPMGTRFVLYACLPVSLGDVADGSLDAARRYAGAAGYEVVAEFVDRADPLGGRDGCPLWHQALGAVEEGRAQGIVTPLMVMLARGKVGHLAAWQRRTGAYLLTSSAIDTPAAAGLPPRAAA
ncbi:hypothetical protein [Streptomyces sp. NPDC093094]|uniref:hypothetical protein n=1 Tax=Streptomyces sp. NPDC093094 TaxID=3366026 RepID=UPI00381B1E42